MNERIALFYPWTNLDTVPCLCDAVEMLASAGFAVDVFTEQSGEFVLPDFGGKAVELHLNSAAWKRHGAYRLFPGSWFLPLVAKRRHMIMPYRCLIGVDPKGLCAAADYNRFVRAPLVYYSLELLLSSEIPASRKDLLELKKREKRLSSECGFIVIQDEQRQRLLAEDNGLPAERFVCVPNSPAGRARRRRSDSWHQRFGLSKEKKIVLYAGSLYEWAGVEQIASSIGTWPDHWVLVIHTRGKGQASYPLKILRALVDPERVLISDQPVARGEYAELVDGADIGVAFYIPGRNTVYNQQNIQVMGLASGKLAYYLHSGLPVIVNQSSTVKGFVRDTGCGIDVGEAAEIGAAIARIDADYSGFSRRASQAFDERLQFDGPFGQVVEALERVAGE